jgi:hypothetical protein
MVNVILPAGGKALREKRDFPHAETVGNKNNPKIKTGACRRPHLFAAEDCNAVWRYCCSDVPGGSILLRSASVSRTVSTTLWNAPETLSVKVCGAGAGAAFFAGAGFGGVDISVRGSLAFGAALRFAFLAADAFFADFFFADFLAGFFALERDAALRADFFLALLTLTLERFTFLAFDAAFLRAFLAMVRSPSLGGIAAPRMRLFLRGVQRRN